jgi:hypothetical protein
VTHEQRAVSRAFTSLQNSFFICRSISKMHAKTSICIVQWVLQIMFPSVCSFIVLVSTVFHYMFRLTWPSLGAINPNSTVLYWSDASHGERLAAEPPELRHVWTNCLLGTNRRRSWFLEGALLVFVSKHRNSNSTCHCFLQELLRINWVPFTCKKTGKQFWCFLLTSQIWTAFGCHGWENSCSFVKHNKTTSF